MHEITLNCWAPATSPDTYVRGLAIDMLGTDDIGLDVTYVQDDDGLVLVTGRAWTQASDAAS